MQSKQQERFGGIFLITIGALLTVWNWQMALHEGRFYFKLALLGPICTVIGLQCLLLPDLSIAMREYPLPRNQTTFWGYVIIAAAFGCGFVNLFALKGWKF